MKRDIIYIVGQPDPQSETAQAIRRLGYRSGILLDRQLTLSHPEEYDRIEKVDFSNLTSELERLSHSDLSVAGLVCTYENYVVAKASLADHFGVAGLSVESARLSTDKSLMRRAFLDKNPAISPDFALIDSVDTALAYARTHRYPLIIKPTNLVKSLLVLTCHNEADLVEKVSYALSTIDDLYRKYHIYDRSPQLIIEDFITGQQCSIAAFVDATGVPHFCEGIVGLKNAQEIGRDDNFLYSRTVPLHLPEALTTQLFDVARQGIEALKMTSVPAHVELMYGPDGVKLIEIGARIGGYRPRMYRYSHDLDLTTQEVRLSIGEQPQLTGRLQQHCAVFELFAESEGAFVRVSGDFRPQDFTYYRETVRPEQKTGPAKQGYKAAAIVIVTHEDEEAFASLCQTVDQLRVEVLS
ncbi:hypothetical protein CL689_01350 [Candidatus Saccharibacteria bacterium]|nr:hypothetical protein [Candidatus Saccharibacteria bacterium]MBJ58384.1 hypothetical protein [Candidatus Saccharibacteria bacterium]MBQ68696.1 hypothetical protein [Candidatus Saccharibacteria bacterium]|tara:strand:+ start:444 stop:1676 length:1233 start_codon:yes stop_codon:yes gene_type:complete